MVRDNPLLRWYALHGRRDLPWRNTSDPYAIYLSEVMLQQTQVTTVLARYYFPFLEKFPTLKALAEAPVESVLKAWEGLGYYTRARNLHRAAIACGTALPRTVDELMKLSGIGKNTAHAIAAFAYHQPVPVMEANVKRVLCRVFALENPSDAQLWEKAWELLDRENPFDYNQAMMDIGAMVCKKKAPNCLLCPLAPQCEGKLSPESYPARKAKKTTPVREKNIIVLCYKNQYLVQQRTSRFLSGLYGFIEVQREQKQFEQWALTKPIGHIEQVYSHFTLKADVYRLEVVQKYNMPNAEWVSPEQLIDLPLSMADRKVCAFLPSLSTPHSFQQAVEV